MAKRRLGKDLLTLAKNLWKHTQRVVTLRESPFEALGLILEDFRKLRHGVKASRRSGDEREARRHLERGRKAYNEKRYTEAEGHLIRALECDERLGWAHCFMGHTAYQLGRTDEAVSHWHRACVVDPHSDAASKARQKIEGMSAKRRQVLDELEHHVKTSSQTRVDL